MINLSQLWDKIENDRINNAGHIGSVCYTLTCNDYAWYMLPSVISLLKNNYVKKIYIVTNGSDWPYSLPDYFEIIDVSDKNWFSNSVNIDYPFSYICFMRVMLSKLIDDDKVLSLDCDTIINGNLEYFWNLPIDDYYFAMTKETRSTYKLFGLEKNYNAGVLFENLKEIRYNGIDDILTNFLNLCKVTLGEQDAINVLL